MATSHHFLKNLYILLIIWCLFSPAYGTTASISAVADTTIIEGSTKPQGSLGRLLVRSRNVSGSGRQMATLLRFDLSANSLRPKEAVLSLFPDETSALWTAGQIKLYVLKETPVIGGDNWSEATFTDSIWLYPDGATETADLQLSALELVAVLPSSPSQKTDLGKTEIKIQSPELTGYISANYNLKITFVLVGESGSDRQVMFKSKETGKAPSLLLSDEVISKRSGALLEPAPKSSLKLANIFTDHMVLQRDQKLPIWGKAEPGAVITVEFAGQSLSCTASTEGKWLVNFDPLSVSASPRELRVTSVLAQKTETVLFTDVLVGDVWLGSGQSNMEWSFGHLVKALESKQCPEATRERTRKDMEASTNPRLRLFVSKKVQVDNGDAVSEGWKMSNPSNILESSAVAWYFAQEVLRSEQVPVGIITAAWGGSRVERWIPGEAFATSSVYAQQITQLTANPVIDGVKSGIYYDNLVRPLAPFGLRGFLWYQGESSLIEKDNFLRYDVKMELLLNSWRNAWQKNDLPLYYVQIAPHLYTKRGLAATALPAFQDTQRRLLRFANTGMAVTSDLVDNLADIHPLAKWEVGRRLWLWASAGTYGHTDTVTGGPLYSDFETKNGKAIIRFNSTGAGLVAMSGELRDFEISGEDGVYRAAQAEIVGNTVVATSSEVPFPVKARYLWNEGAKPSLYNKEGLPASVFNSEPGIVEH